ncbi:hypothetical protein GCM10023063_13220 [Arthrobacter methylotrophus]
MADAFGERGNPAEFGVHSSGENHGDGFPAGAAGAAENHVYGLKQRTLRRPVLCAPGNREGFPGQGGEVHFHRTLEEPGIGADTIAFAHHQHIAADKQSGRDLPLPAIPQDTGLRGKVSGQGFDNPFRVAFLEEGEPGVKKDDGDDCRCQSG